MSDNRDMPTHVQMNVQRVTGDGEVTVTLNGKKLAQTPSGWSVIPPEHDLSAMQPVAATNALPAGPPMTATTGNGAAKGDDLWSTRIEWKRDPEIDATVKKVRDEGVAGYGRGVIGSIVDYMDGVVRRMILGGCECKDLGGGMMAVCPAHTAPSFLGVPKKIGTWNWQSDRLQYVPYAPPDKPLSPHGNISLGSGIASASEIMQDLSLGIERITVAWQKRDDLDAAMLKACRAALSKLREWPRCKDHDAPMQVKCCLPFSGNGKRYAFAGCGVVGCGRTSSPVEVKLDGATERAIDGEAWTAEGFRA